MFNSIFRCVEHVIDAQHTREYPGATSQTQEEVLKLAVKNYTPWDNQSPQPGDLSIIGAHANGFPKELYEPLWDGIYHRLKRRGIAIRGVWIADAAHQGKSGLINQTKLGNDPSPFDHARDLLLMINQFRAQLPRPIVGIGHSMGAIHLIILSTFHPRLLSTVILIDPPLPSSTFNTEGPMHGFPGAALSTNRRDLWQSREEAKASFLKSAYYQRWDPRIFELWVQYGLQEIPTALYPLSRGAAQGAVTLTTTKHQEVFTYLRPLYNLPLNTDGSIAVDPVSHPDLDPRTPASFIGYEAGGQFALNSLPTLRPPTIFILGEESPLSTPQIRIERLSKTGTATGGSGGMQKGKVEDVVIFGAGHLVPMEKVDQTAEAAAAWLLKQVPALIDADRKFADRWRNVSNVEKSTMDGEWRKQVHMAITTSARTKKKGTKL